MNFLGKIFGTDAIVKDGMKLLDEAFYTKEEEAQDKKEMAKQKTQAKVELLTAYAPFKLAQRYIAFAFTGIFLFIMLNGVLGSLYNLVPMENVEQAKRFANEMYLGEIMLAIISFYFGGGLVSSFRDKIQRKDNNAKQVL